MVASVFIPSLVFKSGGHIIPGGVIFDETLGVNYLYWTPGFASDQNTWVVDMVFARGNQTSGDILFSTGTASTNFTYAYIDPNGRFVISDWNSPATWYLASTRVFRDTGIYHLVIAYDDTQATAADRVRVWVNGVQITAWDTATYPTQNYGVSEVNNTVQHQIGNIVAGSHVNDRFDGYMFRFALLDGLAITDPETDGFGETTLDNYWALKNIVGKTFGANGRLYEGAANLAAGTDSSGNGNDASVSGTLTATNDSPTDSGVYGKYATLNPHDSYINSATVSNGNRTFKDTVNQHAIVCTSLEVDPTDSDGWFVNIVIDSDDGGCVVGVKSGQASTHTADPYTYTDEWAYRPSDGTKSNGEGSWQSYGSGAASTIQIAIKDGKIWFGADGTYENGGNPVAGTGAAYTNLTDPVRIYLGTLGGTGTDQMTLQTGSTTPSVTPPAGFKYVATQNMPAVDYPNATAYFNVARWTGNGTTQSITGIGFQPDLLICKNIDSASYGAIVCDVVRGVDKYVFTSEADAEDTAVRFTSFDSDGFSVGGSVITNSSGEDSVAWCFKAGGAGVSNTDGTITSTVSAGAYMSIGTYTGTGANATIGHGLGRPPSHIMVKRLSTAASWFVYHKDIGAGNRLLLNDTAASTGSATSWQSTDPTDSVFYVGTETGVNVSSGEFVFYAFADVPGLCQTFAYTGNGSDDGAFVPLDFEAAWVLMKRADSAGNWGMFDSARDPFNNCLQLLLANSTAAETTATNDILQIMSNGLKHPKSGSVFNASGGTYIGLAIAKRALVGGIKPHTQGFAR